jgi:phosphate:Na+ symporter
MKYAEIVVELLTGLGVFLLGLKLLSDFLERASSKGIRKMFGKISNNVSAGVLTGTASTAIIQSSSATTVMVVGLVNAGMMTLYQAAGIIMGANIGTTATGFIVAASDIKLPINLILSFLAFAGIMTILFGKAERVKNTGWILTGLGVIFVGLSVMTSSVSVLADDPAVMDILRAVSNPFVLILVSMILTAVLQSSSAVNAIIMVLIAEGGMDVASGVYLILGTNIGTCITALLASVGASINAKRASLIHLLFNLFGTVLFCAIMLPFPAESLNGFMRVFGTSPAFQLAWFNLFRNVIPTLVLMPLVKPFVRLTELMIKEKPAPDGASYYECRFIDNRFLTTPAIAVAQVGREIIGMYGDAENNFDAAMNGLLDRSAAGFPALAATEKRINRLNSGITNYLIRLSVAGLSASDEALIGSYYHVVSDLERIGDHATNIMEYAEQMLSCNMGFSESAESELRRFYRLLKAQFADAKSAFLLRDEKKLREVAARENEIDGLKSALAQNHVSRLSDGMCLAENSMIFYGLITDLERAADHLMNIAQSIRPKKIANITAIPETVNAAS